MALAFVITGWLGSSKLLAIVRQTVVYNQKIRSIEGYAHTFEGNAYSLPGLVGGYNTHGEMFGIFAGAENINTGKQISSRLLQEKMQYTVKPGEMVALRSEVWMSNPGEAFGYEYDEVRYTTPIGDMPAWLVPGTDAQRWTILVHGIESDRNAMLRFLPSIHGMGDTALLINYRNDTGAPASPDGYNHISDTEWQDLQAAVAFALDHGAKDIRLFGVSLGGSIVENYLRRAGNAGNVSKVILDSPALNWREILRFRLKQGGYLTIFYCPSAYFAWLRAGIHVRRISTTAHDINHETLLFHSFDDSSVPQAASKRLAAARPDLVTFVDFKYGSHARSWNYDRERYETLVREFLT